MVCGWCVGVESSILSVCLFCFFKQKTAYEMRISDWSSDVCSSDLPYESLTAREREAFHLVIQGKTTKEIAQILDIGVKTAENHRARMMEKLALRNTAEVVRFAALRGLLT